MTFGPLASLGSETCPGCAAWDDLMRAVSHQPSDLWVAGVVLPELEADTSHQAITEMVSALASHKKLGEQVCESLVKTYLFDAGAASTAIDHGLAVLHITHHSVDIPVASVARSSSGIDFQAADGQPAKVFLLLVSPPQPAAKHLRMTATAARLLLNYGRRTGLR
jgi:mannitol/fructose-specific phosphotransferase system IIA component (Ntr-type)